MVTMAKKAKKVRSEVIVTPEQVSALAEQESGEEEEEVKPRKKNKKNKKKNTDSAEASEISDIQPDSVSLVESTNQQSDSKPATITKSSKENMKVGRRVVKLLLKIF